MSCSSLGGSSGGEVASAKKALSSSSSSADEYDDIPAADEASEEVSVLDIVKLSLGAGNKEAALRAAAGPSSTAAPGTQVLFPYNSASTGPNSLDIELSADEAEEKERLISQVLELQNTLDDLSQRTESVKEENLKLKSENQVLGQYIENLMAASSVFQSTSPKPSGSVASVTSGAASGGGGGGASGSGSGSSTKSTSSPNPKC